jgi:fatty acid desaturase
MMMSFGFFMGSAFAPNHKGMPLVPKDSKIDFFQRQVLTSRNVTSNWFKDNFMGGLNFQIEHHLFPSMSRPNLKKAQVIVKQYCHEMGVPFTEMGWMKSMGQVISYLNKVGLSERDPFICPMVANMRPRS